MRIKLVIESANEPPPSSGRSISPSPLLPFFPSAYLPISPSPLLPFSLSFRPRRRAFTLIELVVAVTIVAIILVLGAARYRNAIEQARANVAAANLRAIWSAQRLYWLDQRTYAGNLNSLGALIDPSVVTGTPYYSYAVTSADDTSFTVTATRIGSTDWSGTLAMDQTGTMSGTITGPITITPGFQ